MRHRRRLKAIGGAFSMKYTFDEKLKAVRLFSCLSISAILILPLHLNPFFGLHRKFPGTRNRILHSDQGWQYQRPAYRKRLEEYGIIQSMSRKGNCLDNSKTENLFSKRKKEMFYGHEKEFRSFAELKKSMDEYVDWYNNERIVQRLGDAPVGNRSIAPVPLLCYSPA